MATVLLVRHGRTASNASGTLAGWTEGVGLDEVGRTQVSDLANRLAGIPLVRIVTSPLQRCQETAAALLTGRDLQPLTEEAIGEARYGAWTGRPLKELAKDELWRAVQDHPSGVTFPPSDEFAHESMSAMQQRAVDAIRAHDAAVDAQHGKGAVWAAVSHGDVIKAVLAWAGGTHLDLFQRIVVNPASVSGIRLTAGRPFVLRVNDTGRVDDLVPPAEHAGDTDAAPGGGEGTQG
ncbi:MSMEG_4193 family putative phosphomutase [Calidifontibacter sp. DB0510]|uniref:MSMEG_4193 family putative phosphomutase n=1 Tax=Metallococcus carri TaxID=1656884 RepID=A0A967AZT3_9MICO|nr:MSMEG_4193 family putative phosphomutase [Metallococcus carri]NHN54830.1 MSMEG_4193 family putative phosphomutase [Metallococcus carri]NOP37175.1 MSMEG_4193 family putative phosphomutase [Calidifontibacter sp. DB2511S]